MAKFTHTLDIAFNVHSDQEDWEDVPVDEIIAALEKRLQYIRKTSQEVQADVFGHVDTVEDL